MTWRRNRRPAPSPDLPALEASAAARVADAEAQRDAVVGRAQDVDIVHAQTVRLRQRNRWGALIENVMGGGRAT